MQTVLLILNTNEHTFRCYSDALTDSLGVFLFMLHFTSYCKMLLKKKILNNDVSFLNSHENQRDQLNIIP